jgi:predicted lactoylglutathione lyase
MELSAFSISLAVKDLETSRKFYEKFGFKVFGGDPTPKAVALGIVALTLLVASKNYDVVKE